MLMYNHFVSSGLVGSLCLKQKLSWIIDKINPLIATMDLSNVVLE